MTQTVSLDMLDNSAGGFGLRNKIINGDMRVDQRNNGASVTASGSFPVDRFVYSATQASKGTLQQNAGIVTPPVGFKNYLGFTSSSAYSVLVSDYFVIAHTIEGYNVSDLGWGTANAQAVTLSFRVYSSLTGTFGGSLRNGAYTRSYPFSYTVSSANTWTTVSVTIPGDTTGTWATDSALGITVFFSLGVGSNYTSTANTWAAGNYLSPSSTVSVVGTNNATFYITGVQLERGSVATPFEYRPYGLELKLCQRYYMKSYAMSVVPGSAIAATYVGLVFSPPADQATAQLAGVHVQFPTAMRIAPNIYYWDIAGNATRFSTLSAGAWARVDNVGALSNIYPSEFGFGAVANSGAAASYAFAWVASAEM